MASGPLGAEKSQSHSPKRLKDTVAQGNAMTAEYTGESSDVTTRVSAFRVLEGASCAKRSRSVSASLQVRASLLCSGSHARCMHLAAVQQTSDNTSWNDCGRPLTPGHLGHLLITPHCDQICQQPTQRTSACDYGTGIALTIRILDLADRKQIATRLPCLYYIPQRDRQRCPTAGTG
jgi:hypothetical protein